MDSPDFLRSINSFKTSEYQIDLNSFVPKFYVPPKTALTPFISLKHDEKPLECKVTPGKFINFDSEAKSQNKLSPPCVEQIDVKLWLQKYGLSALKLKFDQILNMIGFKHSEGF